MLIACMIWQQASSDRSHPFWLREVLEMEISEVAAVAVVVVAAVVAVVAAMVGTMKILKVAFGRRY